MSKYIAEDEQTIVATMTAGYMDRFKELSILMLLSPTKGAHIFNMGIVSFVLTAARDLDEALQKTDNKHKLNMHGKEFDNHLDFFIYMFKNGTKKHVE